MSLQLFRNTIETPIGLMDAVASNQGICLLEFQDRKELDSELSALKIHYNSDILNGKNSHLELLERELDSYFRGNLKNFSVSMEFTGTDFQKNVWHALLDIPYAETRTYKEQSLVLGDLKAIRAVASANGKNKLAIIVPCHRVIGSDGNLTGYAGGVERKRFLLNLERKIAGPKDLFNQ